MKKTLLLLSIIGLLFATSCVEDPETTTDFYIINDSNQEIAVNIYLSGEIMDSSYLNTGESKKYEYTVRGGSVSPPPFTGDSLVVFYNDTTQITHLRQAGQDILRNIYYKESWTGGAQDDYEYKYEYIFTDADYEEALNE